MKLVFWGSSDFSMPLLELLAEKHTVAAVVTNPDACCGRGMKEIRMTPVKRFALDHGIVVLQPPSLKEEPVESQLRQIGADLFVTASYGMILPKALLQIPPQGSINLHASLLPHYRGASPVQAAIAAGDTMTGNTIQYMAAKMDAGDIILQETAPIGPDETYPELLSKLAKSGAELTFQAVEMIASGSVRPRPQNDAEATYVGMIGKEHGKISLREQSAREIYNRFRAYQPWPGIYTDYSNTPGVCTGEDTLCVTYLTDVRPVEAAGKPGTILKADRNGLWVACREGAISILKLKPAGKREMDYLSFVNGYRPETGRYF